MQLIPCISSQSGHSGSLKTFHQKEAAIDKSSLAKEDISDGGSKRHKTLLFLSASRLAALLGFTFCLLICVSVTSKFVYFQPFCIFISLFENLKDLIFCHNDAFCQILSSCVAIYCLDKH